MIKTLIRQKRKSLELPPTPHKLIQVPVYHTRTAYSRVSESIFGILNACLTPLQGLFNFLVFMSPKVRNAKRPRRGENLTWRQAFIKACMSKGDRRRTDRNLSSRNTRTGSWASLWMQRVQRSLNSFLPRTSAPDSTSMTTKDQSSNRPRQVRFTAEKLASSNPHLADDMKEAEENNAMRPQQEEEFLPMDGDDDEECKEQAKGFVSPPWLEINK